MTGVGSDCEPPVVLFTISSSWFSVGYPIRTRNINRSSCASGNGYVPSCSIGFCVANTKNGFGSACVYPPTVTWPSCIASRRAACVLGGVLLISSARITFAKTGPFTKCRFLVPVCLSSWITSLPVTSLGIKSGVNWIRENPRESVLATVEIMRVFARPGTPSTSVWPPQNIESNIWSRIASCPTITLLIC